MSPISPATGHTEEIFFYSTPKGVVMFAVLLFSTNILLLWSINATTSWFGALLHCIFYNNSIPSGFDEMPNLKTVS